VQGLADFYFQNNISIYPNPSSDLLTIEYNNKIRIDKIELFDAKGISEKVLNKLALNMQEAGNISIDLMGIPSGIYFIKIKSGELSMVKKVVVMK
jgi:polyhydroxybutyrate depolymerase